MTLTIKYQVSELEDNETYLTVIHRQGRDR